MSQIVLSNRRFTLVLSEKGEAVSLKAGGTETLSPEEPTPFFSVTQERPFNNEVKLAHPNKRTTYPANRLSAEKTEGGFRLRVGFEIAPYDAFVDVAVRPDYMAFTLSGFDCPKVYPGAMTPPPAAAFRLCTLSLAKRERFGEWMNVLWDDEAAVAVMAAMPNVIADSEGFSRRRVLYAEARKELNLIGASAALFAASPDALLDCVGAMEEDFGLPRGAEGRRNGTVNASIFWTSLCNPDNVDEHIKWAKLGGFRYMMLYYTSMFREGKDYELTGNYDWNDRFPNGFDDLKRMCAKIRAAGIVPGFHFLQTHIGLKSRYVTPVADPRLGKVRRFTAAHEIGETDTEIEVEEDPTGCVMEKRCRILQFGGELISYTAYTSERPYKFTGCERGCKDTMISSHPKGEVGSLLDVSEFGGTSCYIDQSTSLQDEIADKIAKIYACGFGFCYFDGSEGSGAPYEINVPLAQYRVWKKLEPKPLLTEGAAKAHFSWHFLTGGNAFDVFPPPVFKAMIDRYPGEEAPRMANDFTALNFGWWYFWTPEGREDGGTQADLYEYGTSRGAAWDCPATIQFTHIDKLEKHPRAADIMEVMRRWEDVRARGLLTDAQKEELKKPGVEHTLLIDGRGNYELVEVAPMETGEADLRAFGFERGGRACASLWHLRGSAKVFIPLADAEIRKEPDGEPEAVERTEEGIRFVLGNKVYLSTAKGAGELKEALKNARFSG